MKTTHSKKPETGRDEHNTEKLQKLSDEIKDLLKKKKDCSHRLGLHTKNNEDTSHLQREMLQIKEKLKQKKYEKKSLLDKLKPDTGKKIKQDSLPERLRFNGVDKKSLQGEIRITRFSEEATRAWDEFVKTHPNATPYHFCSIRKLIKKVFNKNDYSLMAVDDSGNITGVLPLIRLNSILFGDFLVSMPYFNYGGPLALDSNIETRLLDEAAIQSEKLGVNHMEIREIKPRDKWETRKDKVCMILPLPEQFSELESNLGTKIRTQSKRAERENVRVRQGSIELLDDFYHVFAVNMRDLGTPVYSREFFRSLLLCTEFNTRLIVVDWNGEAVACAFLLGYEGLLEIPWASTLKSANTISMNMFLYRQVLEYAIENGYGHFDFGRSSKNSPTYRFKQQWGATPVQNYWHYWLASGESLPQLNPDNPKFRVLIQIWQALPVFVTNIIGPGIVSRLP